MTYDLCIYHANCADGFGAAWAVWKKFGSACEYVAANYGDAPSATRDRNIIVVDFSYKREVLMALAKDLNGGSITILDHHKSAQEDLQLFVVEGLCSQTPFAWNQGNVKGRVRAKFDMEKSGAVLAWEWCHPNVPVPKMLELIEDRDLWRFRSEESRPLHSYLGSIDWTFDSFSWVASACETKSGMETIVAQGSAIDRKHAKDVAKLVRDTRRKMTIGGVEVSVANLPPTMASDAGALMAASSPFAGCYYDVANGRVFSLRSKAPDGADVSEVAKLYGGGGHKHAAGFKAARGWEGDQ